MTKQIHIVDGPAETTDEHGAETSAPDGETTIAAEDIQPRMPNFYAGADDPPWENWGRQTAAFVKALLPEVGKDDFVDDRRQVHHYEQLKQVRLVDELDAAQTEDVDLAVLFALPDESLLFVGSDPTAADTSPFFGFIIEPFEPVPAPATAQDALDLLRPGTVRDAFAEGDEPDRQGEWWLLPTQRVPVGERYKPGVNARPYGPSPLGNHVPREWGMTTPVDEFMSGARERATLPDSVATPPEVVEWVHRQQLRVPTPDSALDWDDIQELAGEILVRGTLRHRENDHFVENLGDDWHLAITHDMEVYTGDDVGRVVLD